MTSHCYLTATLSHVAQYKDPIEALHYYDSNERNLGKEEDNIHYFQPFISTRFLKACLILEFALVRHENRESFQKEFFIGDKGSH